MANIINNQDPNRHIPSAAETGSVEKLAKQFKSRYGTFSDAEGENIVIFARNADNFMTQNLIPSLEMGMIVIYNLKGEPYIRAKRWRDTMDVDPERINADHWREQPFQAATPFMPYQPLQMAQPLIQARPAGVDIHGNPDPNDPGHPGQPQLPFIEMRPPVPAVREQVAVDANHCLKAYLLHTFQKRIDITAAEKFLATFRTQQPKQTCTAFIDTFMVKFEYYITVRWTAAERETPNFRDNVNTIRLQYIKEGLCREFKKHLDSNPQIVTHQQVDDEAQRWARETIEGREFTKNCTKSEASYATASLYFDNKIPQDEEDDDVMELSSSTSTKRKPKDGATRGRGGGNRGGRTQNNNDRNPSIDHRQTGTPKQSKDADGINNYDQSSDGKLTLDHKGRPLCNYCGIANHLRSNCRIRLRDAENGMIRQSHPNKGKFNSGNRGRQDPQQKIANAADQWGDPWGAQSTPQGNQGVQWQTSQPQTQAPMTLTVSDPENVKWLRQATKAGTDQDQIVAALRHMQQSGGQNQTNPEQPPKVSSSLLPSGLVACNDCGFTASTFELADRHQQESHRRLANGPDGRN